MGDLRQKSVNNFLQGMNKDADEALVSNSQYIHAENFRLISDKTENQTGSLSNLRGNIETITSNQLQTSDVYSFVNPWSSWSTWITNINVTVNGLYIFSYQGLTDNAQLYHAIADSINAHSILGSQVTAVASNVEILIYATQTGNFGVVSTITISCSPNGGAFIKTLLVSACPNLKIIGWGQNREETLIFTCPENNTEECGQIWLLTFNDVYDPPTSSLTLLYNNKLNFSINNPIRDTKCNNDSEKSSKIYFTDNNNYLRHFDYTRTDHFATPIGNLDIIGDVVYSKPKLDDITSGGALLAGTVQYAYKYFNTFGGETLFSPTSDMIPLSPDNYLAPNDNAFLGGFKTQDTGKTVSILIENIDRRYDNIEVVSLFYEDLNGTPEINVIHRGKIVADTMKISDSGTVVLGTYGYNEFVALGGILFKCKSFDTKNNLILPGNIELEEFDVDFDARAYGWNIVGGSWQCNIKDRFGNLGSVDPTTYNYAGTSEQVAEEHDAINPLPSLYRYQNGTHNRGGTGPNVSYKIKTISLPIAHEMGIDYRGEWSTYSALENWTAELGSDFVTNKSGLTGYANPFNASQLIGYQRDETYRYGIVFYSTKGLRSPVKWIADIKMPSIHDIQSPLGEPTYYKWGVTAFYDYPIFYSENGLPTIKYALILGIEFDVNIPASIRDQISGYEIVRVKRDRKDRSIVTQAMMFPTALSSNADGTYYCAAHGAGPLTGMYYTPVWAEDFGGGVQHMKATFRLASPEICTDETFDVNQGTHLKILGRIEDFQNGSVGAYNEVISTINMVYGVAYQVSPISIKDAKKATPSYEPITFSADNAVNMARNIHRNDNWTVLPTGRAFGGTSMFVSLNSLPPTVVSEGYLDYKIPICNVIKTLTNQYGGNYYENRQNNTYISTGAFRRITSDNVTNPENSITFGGDIYITVFDYSNIIWSFATGAWQDSRSQIYLTPLESHINCDYRQTSSFRKNKTRYLQEGPTSYVDSVGIPPFSYIQDYYLYVYNPVYSNQNYAHNYVTKLPLEQNITKYDTRLYASERKQVGELKDNWTKYLLANYIDLNKHCGVINKVLNFKNNLYVIQDHGIGVASVDDRSVIADQTGQGLVLGTGGVLPRFDYISMDVGTRHQFSVLTSPDSMFFFDSSDRQIKMLGEGTSSLTEAKGLRTFMYNNVIGYTFTNDNPQLGNGISCYYDNNYGEVVYTFHYYTEERGNVVFTVVYNESAQCFTSFYSYASPIYIRPWSKVLSVLRTTNQSDSIWLHDEGNYCSYYSVVYPSKIHLLLNHNYAYTKVHDSLSIVFNSENINGNILQDFFNRMRCYNKYQNTDWHDLIWNTITAVGKQINYDRRETGYTLILPRNIVDADITTNPNIFDPVVLTNPDRLYRERLRCKALHVELEYDNSNNYKIYFPLIEENYRISIR